MLCRELWGSADLADRKIEKQSAEMLSGMKLVMSSSERDSIICRVEHLDAQLFSKIPSQSSERERIALLAIQRATVQEFEHYVYLEIGSHLGGSIQPHYLHPRCSKIYSIDPRPAQQPDDRHDGIMVPYENNSSERMLSLLAGLEEGPLAKVQCIEMDASRVDPMQIDSQPHIAFIDGAHTYEAVLSDFSFCRRVLHQMGTIVFHDFQIVDAAVMKILSQLRREGVKYLGVKLDDTVFALFFSPKIARGDPYLRRMSRRTRLFWPYYKARKFLSRWVPLSFWEWLWEMRHR